MAPMPYMPSLFDRWGGIGGGMGMGMGMGLGFPFFDFNSSWNNMSRNMSDNWNRMASSMYLNSLAMNRSMNPGRGGTRYII